MQELKQFHHFVEVDGYQVETYDNGLNGEAVFVFHANSGSAELSKNIFTQELAQKYRIISVSLLGHGKTEWSRNPETDYSIPGIGNFISKLVASYNFKNYWLIGSSVSAHAIFENIQQFTSCRGMLSLSAPPINIDTLSQAFAENEHAPLLFKGKLEKHELLELAANFTCFTQNIKMVKTTLELCDPQFRERLGESIMQANVNDEIAALKNSPFPISFIQSRYDSFLRADYFSQLVKIHQLDLKVTFVEHAGHLLILDNCEECFKEINSFLGNINIVNKM